MGAFEIFIDYLLGILFQLGSVGFGCRKCKLSAQFSFFLCLQMEFANLRDTDLTYDDKLAYCEVLKRKHGLIDAIAGTEATVAKEK